MLGILEKRPDIWRAVKDAMVQWRVVVSPLVGVMTPFRTEILGPFLTIDFFATARHRDGGTFLHHIISDVAGTGKERIPPADMERVRSRLQGLSFGDRKVVLQWKNMFGHTALDKSRHYGIIGYGTKEEEELLSSFPSGDATVYDWRL